MRVFLYFGAVCVMLILCVILAGPHRAEANPPVPIYGGYVPAGGPCYYPPPVYHSCPPPFYPHFQPGVPVFHPPFPCLPQNAQGLGQTGPKKVPYKVVQQVWLKGDMDCDWVDAGDDVTDSDGQDIMVKAELKKNDGGYVLTEMYARLYKKPDSFPDAPHNAFAPNSTVEDPFSGLVEATWDALDGFNNQENRIVVWGIWVSGNLSKGHRPHYVFDEK